MSYYINIKNGSHLLQDVLYRRNLAGIEGYSRGRMDGKITFLFLSMLLILYFIFFLIFSTFYETNVITLARASEENYNAPISHSNKGNVED